MKKFFKNIFIVFMVALISSAIVCADELSNIQQKHKAASEKINRLKVLERLEQNKLYKNQQKLEQASTNLETSKSRMLSLESQLAQLERDLARTVLEYNNANADMKKRIRQVYKSQRTGMFQLILNARDLNSLLDVVYFEKLILKRDYANIMAVKAKSQRIASMKKDVQTRKVALAQSIQSINSQQKKIYILIIFVLLFYQWHPFLI